MSVYDVIVIGGGASGLISAISAARHGAKVVIIEKTDRIGRKLLATGNGRCNMSNTNIADYKYNSDNSNFPLNILMHFNVDDTLGFFNELGILHRIESEGRVYPFSEQAAAVLDVLLMEVNRLNIDILYDSPVKNIDKKNNIFYVNTPTKTVSSQKVIIACGGMAGHQYGADGSGYIIAQKFGHRIITPNPALVQILSNQWYNKRLKGVRVKGQASLVCDGEKVKNAKGEIQFNEDGISGICIFDLSRDLHEYINCGKKCFINIDMFPDYTYEDVIDILEARLTHSPNKTIEEFLIGLINKKLISVILKLSGIKDMTLKASRISQASLAEIAKLLKGWEIPVSGTRSWEHAQVTAGGVDTREIDEETLESRKISGLYFAGEIMDVDGICGGYNLQWAWSSGYIAGKNAANSSK